MIKILHCGLSPNSGGIENYLMKLWNNINHQKFCFVFVDMYEGRACFREQLEKKGCLFYEITHRRENVFKYYKDWKRVLQEADINILHCHFNTLSDITPVLLGLKYGKKVIVHSRSSKMTKSIITSTMHWINFLRLPRKKIQMVAVSEKAGKWLFGKQANFQVINNGVDTGRFCYSIEFRKSLREQYGLQDSFVVGHVGTFLPVKNHEFTLKIFKEIVTEVDSAKLILIGEGPLKERMLKLARDMGLIDSIIFLGKRDDVAEWYSAMDVMVFPSFFEGFPNAVLEAQSTGLPCVISDVITDEVIKFSFCKKQSLNADVREWAKMILDVREIPDRKGYCYKMEKLRCDTKSEIQKIEYLYKSI